MVGESEGVEVGDIEEKQPGLHELCRGAFEPLRNAIHSELMFLPGCRLLYEEGGGAISSSLNKEAVLEHIILDMTGSPATNADHDANNASLQRTLRRTKRLLSRKNSVLLFRLIIMVLVACMLMVTTLLTWNFTRTFSARSIKNLAFALRTQILRISLSSLAFTLTGAYDLSLSLSVMHQHTALRMRNSTWPTIEDELKSINWRFFQSERQLHSVAFVSRDGHATDFTRSGHAEFLYYINESTGGGRPIWYSQPITGSLNGSTLEAPSKSLSGPFQDMFMADLLAHYDVVWSIDTVGSQQQLVSAAVPVVVAQQVLGMSVVTTTLKEMRHYLSSIDLLGGYLFVIRLNASGGSNLVETSYTHPNDIHQEPRRAKNAYVAEAATFLDVKYGSHLLLQNETHSEDVSLNGEQFYIDTMPLESRFRFLNLAVVILVPRRSIMGERESRSKTVVKVSVCAALGVLVIGFVFICCLTRRMSTEMQLRQELIRQLVAKHKAEQSSNYKSQFLANMSHEMRTPMAGIIGLLDLLACDTLTPDQEMSVAQIRRCATGLLALVNNVLDISKVESGKMELQVELFNVSEELESLVDMFAVQSMGSGVDVTLELSDEIPQFVKGDVARIRQIFTNLLSNSVKFTESGHILVRGWMDQSLLAVSRKGMEHSLQEAGGDATKVLVALRRSRSSMGSGSHRECQNVALAFEIDDTGCGIPATLQETVFDRFVQADSSTTRSHGGSGLGLYIVRSLVNMMGGDVQIASKPGPGTRMRFHLVLERANQPDSANVGQSCSGMPPLPIVSQNGLSAFVGSPASNFEEARHPSPELLAQTHVLVAMPENVTKTVAVSWLQRRGLRVTSVNNWEDIVPTLNRLCRSCVTEGTFLGHGAPKSGKEVHYMQAESPSSPFALPSGGSSSCVSEITAEWSRHPVLALIDVALVPGINSPPKNRPSNVTDNLFSELNDQKNIQRVLDALRLVQGSNEVLIAWVAPPNSSVSLKRTLQSLPSSVVLKKPLHCSRMKRLLRLLADVGKLDQRQVEVLGYTSSDPSTPLLTGVHGPVTEVWDRKGPSMALGSRVGQLQSCPIGTAPTDESSADEHLAVKVHAPNSGQMRGAPQSAFQERLFLHISQHGGVALGDSPSTPESPTSGLITPEGANSLADGVQEVRKDSIYAKDLENEWKGPVIDLNLPSKSKSTALSVMKGAHHLVKGAHHFVSEPSTAIVSARESPSTTEPASPLANSNKEAGVGPAVLAGIHILLVEDTPVLQRLTSMMLKKLGAEVMVVGDGLQAVEVVTKSISTVEKEGGKDGWMDPEAGRKEPFDLILMDCAMPVMDGYGATKAIREAERKTGIHIPIVALTAHALASDEEKCLAIGMDAYLTKPINCKQLVSTVQSLVVAGGGGQQL